jgi:FkbM family methyltransferase
MLADTSEIRVRGHVLRIDPQDLNIGKKLALYGEYEQYLQEVLLSLAVSGSAVVDVGANIGLHAIPLSDRVGPAGQVLAFEPDPRNYELLLTNTDRNNSKNVVIFNTALSSDRATALLYQSSTNRGGLSLCEANVDKVGVKIPPIHVQTAPGDDFLANLERPLSLVKIDVEGAEPLVLRGMKGTLRRNWDVKIVFEFWPQYVRNFNVDPLAFLNELEEDQFKFSIIDGRIRTLKPATVQTIIQEGEASDTALNILAARNGVTLQDL